ncbi:esterase/lipase family protein [Runella sp.]|uniref:esterase/lipase family protein n=1 Tax=Runella sp. TaxID=1960881 RepID=UPI003D0C812E
MAHHQSYAQLPSMEWQQCIGGSGEERAASIAPTFEGGSIVAGYSYTNDYSIKNALVVKLNSQGQIQWQQTIGTINYFNEAYHIKQSLDSNYIVTGSSYYNGNEFGWIAKLDKQGSILWQKTIDILRNRPTALEIAGDGNIIILGYSILNGSYSDADSWILKMDSEGNTIWQQMIETIGFDILRSISKTIDGGYITAGFLQTTSDSKNFLVVKLDSQGQVQWRQQYGGSNHDDAYSVSQTSDGGYIIAGESASSDGHITGQHGSLDYWVLKLSSQGQIQWQKSLGGSGQEGARSIQQTRDEGYVVGGYTQSVDGDVTSNHSRDYSSDAWLVKLNDLGQIIWQQCYGGIRGEEVLAIHKTADGGCVFAGYTSSNDGDVSGNQGGIDFWVVKLKGIHITGFQHSVNLSTSSSLQLLSDIQPFKVCADGSNVSVFTLSAPDFQSPSYWKLRIKEDPNVIDKDRYGHFDSPSIASNGIQFIYNHPIIPPAAGLYEVYHIEAVNQQYGSVVDVYDLHLYRPPLLMVHGKADKGSSYIVMYNQLQYGNLYTRNIMLKADYRKTHNDHFEVNKEVVKNHINRLLGNAVHKKFAAGKVDIVAHSMGGLLSRIYLQSDGYQGDINKLITHNTPHSGAHSANRLADPAFAETAMGSIARSAGDWGGAAYDLQVGHGKTIANTLNNQGRLNKNKVPVHAIGTVYPHTPPPEPSAKYKGVRFGYNMSLNDLFGNDLSDYVVSYESQLGGLAGDATSLINLQAHSQAQENSQLISKVIELLKSSPKTGSFSTNGYAPKMLEYVAPASNGNPPNGRVSVQLPLNGKTVNKGGRLQFSLSGTNLDSINVFIKAKEGNWVLLASQGNSLIEAITIDTKYEVGKYTFLALGYCTNGEPVFQEGTFMVADCKESYPVLSGDINNSEYQARNTIVSNGKVGFGETILMTAGKSIEFKPGFEADRFTMIEARIEGCDSN